MVNRILIILVSAIAAIVLFSCANKVNIYDHTAAIVDLGNNYYYLGDGRESQILLNLKPDAKSKVGKTIIPPEVIQYNFDESYIIAQTIERINSKDLYKYWIVEKTEKNQDLIISIDSIKFYKKLDSLLIKIKLKPRQ